MTYQKYERQDLIVELRKLKDRYEVGFFLEYDYPIEIMTRDFRTYAEAHAAFTKAKELIQFFAEEALPPRPKNPAIITPDELGTYEQQKRFGEYYD